MVCVCECPTLSAGAHCSSLLSASHRTTTPHAPSSARRLLRRPNSIARAASSFFATSPSFLESSSVFSGAVERRRRDDDGDDGDNDDSIGVSFCPRALGTFVTLLTPPSSLLWEITAAAAFLFREDSEVTAPRRPSNTGGFSSLQFARNDGDVVVAVV